MHNAGMSDPVTETAPPADARPLLLLVDGAADIQPQWLQGCEVVGLTAGASAPEQLVQGVVERLRGLGATAVEELDGKPEDIVFALPRELRVQLV